MSQSQSLTMPTKHVWQCFKLTHKTTKWVNWLLQRSTKQEIGVAGTRGRGSQQLDLQVKILRGRPQFARVVC
eukprot:6198422-Pleurochrysis_carterae.AAC.2